LRQRFHLDVGIRIPAEMPEAALGIGQDRIDRGIVEVENSLPGLRSLYLVTKSVSAPATDEPLPCVM
jgi:hypothetical protein